MSLVRIYDLTAAIFCLAWIAYFSRIALSFDGHFNTELLIGASLAYWGRRSRIWAAALGGAVAVSSSNFICTSAYYRQAWAEGRVGDALADNPIAEGFQSMSLGVVAALISGVVAAMGKELSRRDADRRLASVS